MPPLGSSIANTIVETFNVHVQEVSLVLSVTDRKGKFVNSLSPSDLTVLDNGAAQTRLTFFERQTDLPLKVAIVLDISASVAYRFDDEQRTIKSFLKAVVRPFDSVMLYAFNQDVQFAAPVTNNWKELVRHVKKLDLQGDTALYDAVSAAAGWLSSDPSPARRIMILISDGEENTSAQTIDEAITTVLRSEAAIYAVNVNLFRDSKEANQGVAILKRLTDATGGTYLEASEGDNMDSAFSKIRRELRSQYALGYKLPNPGTWTFHRLQILVPRQLRVRCRLGYFVK